MSERSDHEEDIEQPEHDDPASRGNPEPGHPVAGEDVGTHEKGPGGAKADVTQKIADDANKEQTQHPAPEDDVGVPHDPPEGSE